MSAPLRALRKLLLGSGFRAFGVITRCVIFGMEVALSFVMKIRVFVEESRETGMFLVSCPELPGCSAVHESRDHALDEVRGLIQGHFRPERWVYPGADTDEIEL